MALSAKCSCFVSHRPLEAPSLLREVNDLAQSLIDLQTAEVKKMCVEARKTPDRYATVFCLGLGRLQSDYFFTKSGHIFCEGRCWWWSAGTARARIFLQRRSQWILQSDESGRWTQSKALFRSCWARSAKLCWNMKSKKLLDCIHLHTYYIYTYTYQYSHNHTTTTTTTATTATTRMPQRRALFRHLNFQKWSEHGVFCAFWLPHVLRATTACTFSTCVKHSGVLYILTWKFASRHNTMHFFDISTSKSCPTLVCFVHFDL